jgi:O-antigen ligase
MNTSALRREQQVLPAGTGLSGVKSAEPSSTVFLLLLFVLLGRPQDFFPLLAPLRLALVFTMLCLVMTYNKARQAKILRLPESRRYLWFYAVMIAGIPFAVHRRMAFDHVFLAYLANVIFFYLCLVHIDSLKKIKTTVFVICLSILFYSAFSLAMGSFSSGRFFYGTMYDPNDLAYFLVSLFPLSLLFVFQSASPAKKMAGSAAAVASVAAILFSGSRGGFIGFTAAVTMLLFSGTARLKPLYKLAVIGGVLCIALLYGERINTERYLSLKNISADYNVTDEFGRKKIWEQGLHFVLTRPLTGVGAGCFSKAIGDWRASRGEIPKWQAPHNSYLQVAAETGLIGFGFFLSLILLSYRNLQRQKKNSREGQGELNDIAALLHAGFAGSLAAAFFLSQGYSVLFTLFFALSAVIRKLAVETQPAVNSHAT